MKKQIAALLVISCAGCSVGEGTGDVTSSALIAKDCWTGSFDLKPDFFAASPSQNTMYIRVQRGSDKEGVSDGVTILVDDINDIRTNHLGQPIEVTLPRGVQPPGVVPGTLCPSTGCSTVHLTLFLLHSCFTENTGLYGVSGTITFTHLFDGDPSESDASKRLTEGEFDVMVGNPQDVAQSGPMMGTIPNQSELKGNFRFFYERGQPAQPFP